MPTTAMADMPATAVAMDTERGLLMPSPLLLLKLIMAMEDTVVMEATVDTALAAMVATDTERGPLMPMPTTAMADMPATAVAMDTDMERGQLMLMPMLMAMADTALAMEATAMAVMVDTVTARGPLMPMPTTARGP